MRVVYRFAVAIMAAGAFAAEYFPDGCLGENPKEHQFNAEWYSKNLTALREPSIWELSMRDPKAEVYRFLWLRSFHHPVCVRLNVTGDETGVLSSKETNGKGGYEPGRLVRDTAMRLSKRQIEWFRDQLAELGFWNLPTHPHQDPRTVHLDGAQWIIEVSKDGRYHIVDRWSPPQGDPIHVIGMILIIDMAHLKLLYPDVY